MYEFTLKNGHKMELSFDSRLNSPVAQHLAGHVKYIEPTKYFPTVNKNKIVVLEES